MKRCVVVLMLVFAAVVPSCQSLVSVDVLMLFCIVIGDGVGLGCCPCLLLTLLFFPSRGNAVNLLALSTQPEQFNRCSRLGTANLAAWNSNCPNFFFFSVLCMQTKSWFW